MDMLPNAWPGLARATDNANAHEAARAASAFVSHHQLAIVRALFEHGPMGRFALARVTGLDAVAIARRMPELVRDGRARVVPEARERTPSGRTGSVWEALRD